MQNTIKSLEGTDIITYKLTTTTPPKQWLHPAYRTIATDSDNTQEEVTPINIYTDGSKSEQGVGAGIAIIIPGTQTVKLMHRMDTSCTNKQAEAF